VATLAVALAVTGPEIHDELGTLLGNLDNEAGGAHCFGGWPSPTVAPSSIASESAHVAVQGLGGGAMSKSGVSVSLYVLDRPAGAYLTWRQYGATMAP